MLGRYRTRLAFPIVSLAGERTARGAGLPLHEGRGAGMSTQRLGLTVVPGAGWRASDVRNVAREAEAAGFDAIFTTEVNNDALATAQLMGSATTHIQIGTWIANIYLRHSYTCAKGASLIADDTGGRFVLGLGVSHRPVNDALTIDMSNALADLHRYAIEVRNWLDGNGPATHLPQQPAPVRVPVYIATLSLAAVERAAEIADGIMPTMWSPERVTQSAARADQGRARAPHLPALDITLGLPTFTGDDLGSLRDAARQNLGLYTFFPYFQRMWRESGFGIEADQMKEGRRTGRAERSPAGLLLPVRTRHTLPRPPGGLPRRRRRPPHPQSANRTRRRARCDPRIRDVGHRGGAADPDTHVTCVREQGLHPRPTHYEPKLLRCSRPARGR